MSDKNSERKILMNNYSSIFYDWCKQITWIFSEDKFNKVVGEGSERETNEFSCCGQINPTKNYNYVL